MRTCSEVAGFIESETRALLTRLDSLQLLSYRIPAVRAASVDPAASEAIDRHIVVAKRELRALARRTVTTAGQRREHQREQQLVRNYSLLRLRFMATLNQLDIFADAVSQRAESDYGVWLAGLDAVARDALRIPGVPTPPPLVVYLDRGAGAAIRRHKR